MEQFLGILDIIFHNSQTGKQPHNRIYDERCLFR